MGMKRIKKGDEVIILIGKDKGRHGKVLSVSLDRVLVEGINMVKKCVRPNPNKNEQGGIIDREASLALSNVALYNPSTKKADKVGFKILADGKKIRVFKSSGEAVEV